MFFISGLLVWGSLKRKGTWVSLRDRLVRLGVPFAFGLVVLVPLSYYPALLEIGLIYRFESSFGEFWVGMTRHGFGTAGPLWFLWLLIVFDSAVALVHALVRKIAHTAAARRPAVLSRTWPFFLFLLALSTAAYLPMVPAFGPLRWFGAVGRERSVLRSGGTLERGSWLWMAAGLLSYLVSRIIAARVPAGTIATIVDSVSFTLSCLTISLGILGLSLRHEAVCIRFLKVSGNNAFGIYIVHYPIVTWLQFWQLGAEMHPVLKASIVFIASLAASWAIAVAYQRASAALKHRAPFTSV